MVVCMFLEFSLFLGTELAFVFHFGLGNIFLICCCWGSGLIPLPFASCVWLVLTEFVFITLSFWSNGLRGMFLMILLGIFCRGVLF